MKIFLPIIFCLLCSCSLQKIATYFPNRSNTELIDGKNFKNSSPEFKKGWSDGCEAGAAAGSNTFYQTFYKGNKIDGYALVNSSDYAVAWGNAWWYCTRADAIQQTSVWGSVLGGYK